MFRALLFTLLLFQYSSTVCQSLYFPPKSGTWSTVNPTELGWCTDKIDTLYDFLEKGDTKAFIVLKDGKIAMEKYFGTFTQDSLWYWASAGKTLTATAIGIALQNGKLKLSDTSSKYLGKGWSSLTPEQEAKITVWHHLTMTTGLDDAVSNPDCTDKACLTYKAEPGTRWAYHNAPYTLLDKILLGATGQNINAYVTAQIKPNTGITGAYVPLGYNNVYFSTARSFAKFGLLLLAHGKWDGNAVLSDSAYFSQMTNSSQSLNLSYGYLTWLNGKSSYVIPQSQLVLPGSAMPAAPNDMFSALGKNGQYINVVPSKGLVLIRMGNEPSTGGGLVPTVFNNNIWKIMNQILCNSTTQVNVTNATDFNIFPVPAQNTLQINCNTNDNFLVEIYNHHAQLIFSENGAKNIDTEGFQRGIYYVKITFENRIITKKIILN